MLKHPPPQTHTHHFSEHSFGTVKNTGTHTQELPRAWQQTFGEGANNATVLNGFAGSIGCGYDADKGVEQHAGRCALTSWLYLLLAIALPSKCREDMVRLGRHAPTLVWCVGCTHSLWLFCVSRSDSSHASAARLGHRTQSTEKTQDVSRHLGSFVLEGGKGWVTEEGNAFLIQWFSQQSRCFLISKEGDTKAKAANAGEGAGATSGDKPKLSVDEGGWRDRGQTAQPRSNAATLKQTNKRCMTCENWEIQSYSGSQREPTIDD